jgi:glycosyltransferase involved in cell wall biosynthesis
MKVLMFGWEFPPQITGGLGTACYGITKSLANLDVNVLFVVPKAVGNKDIRFAIVQDAGEIPSKYAESGSKGFWEKVKYKEIFARLVPYIKPEDYSLKHKTDIHKLILREFNKNQDFTPFSGSYGIDLWNEMERYTLVTSLLARKEKYDIIHAHDWLTFPAAISAKNISGKPLITHIHSTEFDRNSSNISRDIYEIEKKGMDRSDKIITVSNYTRDIVITHYAIHPGKVLTIHNGVDKDSRSDMKRSERLFDEKIVTFLGRITFQKGPEYFIEAAYKVLQKQSNVRFVMAGSGDLMEKIVRQVTNLGISAKVSFPGFLKCDEVKKLFSKTDLFVMPSVSEPFGITTLEALKAKVPVIISKQSGVSEVIKNAIKVDYWDINALADAIYGILNYKILSDLLSSEGRKEANRLRWERTGKQILNVYKSLV